MKIIHSIFAQLRASRRTIAVASAVSATLLGFLIYLHYTLWVPFGSLTRDPAVLERFPIYTGMFSQLGIFFWAAAATICFFSAGVLANRPEQRKWKRYLTASGVLTLLLGLDDVFMFHDSLLPDLDVPGVVAYFIYLGFMLYVLIGYFRVILETEFSLLGLSLFFFAASIAVDQIQAAGLPISYFFEDGTKMVGIVFWMFYYLRVGRMAVLGKDQPLPPGSNPAADWL